ncbi:MAG: LLM class flavin-dependent oxidoreductase [Actinobacteria bacterium]|nr:LLM class flavin-dependent oxidoreductase [Actinomycetota bacterium]
MVKLGVTLPQFTDDPAEVVDGARRARDAGLDSVFVFDHLWPLTGGKERPIFESWTTLTHIAAIIDDIDIGTLVTRSSLRHPAVLAKMAATVAAIAPGRLIVAIGSGDEMSRPENEAYGIPYYGGDDRAPQMISTADAVHRFVTTESVSMSDDYVELDDLPASPAVEPPKVWLAGRSRPVLEAAGRVGDGWNGWAGTPERFAHEAAIVKAAAAGRDIQLTWGGLVIMADTDDAAQKKLGKRDPKEYVVGGPDTVARALGRFIEAGATHLVVTFTDAAEPSNYLRLGSDVRRLLALG